MAVQNDIPKLKFNGIELDDLMKKARKVTVIKEVDYADRAIIELIGEVEIVEQKECKEYYILINNKTYKLIDVVFEI